MAAEFVKKIRSRLILKMLRIISLISIRNLVERYGLLTQTDSFLNFVPFAPTDDLTEINVC